MCAPVVLDRQALHPHSCMCDIQMQVLESLLLTFPERNESFSFKVTFTQGYNTSKHQRREMSVRRGVFLKGCGFLMFPPIMSEVTLNAKGLMLGGPGD